MIKYIVDRNQEKINVVRIRDPVWGKRFVIKGNPLS